MDDRITLLLSIKKKYYNSIFKNKSDKICEEIMDEIIRFYIYCGDAVHNGKRLFISDKDIEEITELEML